MTEICKPEFTHNVGGYTFWWESLNVKVVVDRLSDEGVGEIAFYYVNGSTRLLKRSKENLLSGRTMTSLAKELNKNIEIDWDTILTYVCTNSIDAMREGEPLIKLESTKYGNQKPEMLLPPLFVKNAVNTVYADYGSAKSYFLITVGLILQMELTTDLQLPPVGRHNVLWLDWENDPNIVGWQMSCLGRGFGQDFSELNYRHCSRPLADDIGAIRDKVAECNADVVMIDSLGMAVGDDLMLTRPAFKFFAALREIPGITPILIGHTAKSLDNKAKTVYGNAFYQNESRMIWEFQKTQEQESPELTLTLFNRKSPPFMGLHSDMAFQFSFDGDKTTVETTTPVTDKRQAEEKVDRIQVVYEIISQCRTAIDAKQINNEMQGDANTLQGIYVDLGKLKKPSKHFPIPRIKEVSKGKFSVNTESTLPLSDSELKDML